MAQASVRLDIEVSDDCSEALINHSANQLEDVLKELVTQVDKWGLQSDVPQSKWMVILVEEVGECAREICEIDNLFDNAAIPSDVADEVKIRIDNLLVEYIQVAAVALSAARTLKTQITGVDLNEPN